MKILLKGEEYQLTETTINKFFQSILDYALSEYSKIPDQLKLLTMAVTRGILTFAELKEPDAEKKKRLRPEKRADPTEHIIKLLILHLAEIVPQLAVEIQTDERNIVSATFAAASKNTDTSGGSVSTHGNIGEREDDGGKASRQASSEALPNASPLYS